MSDGRKNISICSVLSRSPTCNCISLTATLYTAVTFYRRHAFNVFCILHWSVPVRSVYSVLATVWFIAILTLEYWLVINLFIMFPCYSAELFRFAVLPIYAYSGQIVGERGGTAFPFLFWRGNAVPIAYTTAVCGRGKRPSVVRWQLPTTQATEKNVR